jgi:hypothetical protein
VQGRCQRGIGGVGVDTCGEQLRHESLVPGQCRPVEGCIARRITLRGVARNLEEFTNLRLITLAKPKSGYSVTCSGMTPSRPGRGP